MEDRSSRLEADRRSTAAGCSSRPFRLPARCRTLAVVEGSSAAESLEVGIAWPLFGRDTSGGSLENRYRRVEEAS